MSQDYSAYVYTAARAYVFLTLDDCFAEFCLSWTVDCKVDPPEPTQAAAVPAMAGVTTRQQSRQSPHTVSLDPDPVSGGANFVDVTLKVKVEMSVGTLIVFRPKNLHGTTRLCGAHTRAATICFASRIKAAFEKAQQGLLVELHAGAGEGGAGEGALFEYKVSQSHGVW
ncbi:hypothetical protein B0H14DRAFT_2607641 [Mycena olivaceomarginata]|nr:hypothetical protein B0H14DRAFT_2607641 [Mycena olivaceomarginata]